MAIIDLGKHYTIERLTPKYTVQATDLITSTFFNNPIALATYAGLSEQKRYDKARRRFSTVIVAGLRYGRIQVIRDLGRVAAISIAYPPRAYPLPVVGNQLRKMGSLSIGPKYIRRNNQIEADLAERHIVEPHWYLEYVGVHPECQGQGLGNALVQHLAKLADSDHVPCYLETDTQKNVDFYLSQGYNIVSEGPVNKLPDLAIWTMCRPKR